MPPPSPAFRATLRAARPRLFEDIESGTRTPSHTSRRDFSLLNGPMRITQVQRDSNASPRSSDKLSAPPLRANTQR